MEWCDYTTSPESGMLWESEHWKLHKVGVFYEGKAYCCSKRVRYPWALIPETILVPPSSKCHLLIAFWNSQPFRTEGQHKNKHQKTQMWDQRKKECDAKSPTCQENSARIQHNPDENRNPSDLECDRLIKKVVEEAGEQNKAQYWVVQHMQRGRMLEHQVYRSWKPGSYSKKNTSGLGWDLKCEGYWRNVFIDLSTMTPRSFHWVYN